MCRYMKTFKLSAPPTTPGIYVLRNIKTQHTYVGQTQNLNKRFFFWKSLFHQKIGAANPKIISAAQATNIDDWEFRILAEGGDQARLLRLEQRAMNLIAGSKSAIALNINLAAMPVAPHPRARAVVIGPNGPMSHQQVADALGIKRNTAIARIKYYRHKGVTKLSLDDLRPRRLRHA